MPKAYENAGVSVEAGYEVVKRIKSHVARTNRPGVVGGIGGFGGLFDLASLGYKEPVLISGTDGVGTKLMVAKLANKHDTIGIDCVAMCVNDIAAQGAEPLFFLDYIACGKNDPALLEQVVAGVADGCVQAGSALVGGETAEMPGMYDEDEYDLAGFSVGVAEKSAIVDGSTIAEGDVLIGLPSTGVHSNGFSLVRKVLLDILDMRFLFLLVLQSLLFTAMFMFLPNRRNRFWESLPGGLLASIGWLLFSNLYSIYVTHFPSYANIYGSVYAIAISMLWLYCCLEIIFFGGALNQLLARLTAFIKNNP